MRLVVLAVSAFMVLIGAFGAVAPAGLGKFVDCWKSRLGLWVAVVLRVIFGVALWFVAPSSRTPLVLKILAVVVIAAGVLMPLMGYPRYEALLAWWQRQPLVFVRSWCFVAIVFGAFVLWSIMA
jgi:hypothetical protein